MILIILTCNCVLINDSHLHYQYVHTKRSMSVPLRARGGGL